MDPETILRRSDLRMQGLQRAIWKLTLGLRSRDPDKPHSVSKRRCVVEESGFPDSRLTPDDQAPAFASADVR